MSRRHYTGCFKLQLALEAAQEQHTFNKLSSTHGVHPNQISQWKRQLLEEDSIGSTDRG